MRLLRSPIAITAILALTACATAPTPPQNRGSVRIVSVTPIEPANEGGAADGGAADLFDEAVPAESLETVDAALDTRDALDRAIRWATEALELYEAGGDHETVRLSLHDAHIALLEADLPEAMQEQGLSMLNCSLPAGLRQHDLEALRRTLELEHGEDAGAAAEHAYIEREARRILSAFRAPTPSETDLRVLIEEVASYVDYYRGKQRGFFDRAYGRQHKYWPTIQAIFTERGIPVELGYMALVESGFNPRARSHANAIGLWQFIPATGKRYGLRQREDFHDVVKSTQAAAEYLLDLIGIFGSDAFLLATAAYNAGEGRISGCLRKLDDPFAGRSFWAIRQCLAPETREYIPRILAAAVIGRDPKRLGFDLPSEAEVRAAYDIVTIPRPTRLATIAHDAGTTVAELRTVNTDLASSARATPSRNFPLYIPRGGGARLAEQLSARPTEAAPTARSSAPPATPLVRSGDVGSPAARERRSQIEYPVQRGDSLGKIAETFGVAVEDIRSWNPYLRNRVLYTGDRLTLYPAAGRIDRIAYEVQNGDTLSEIADRYSVSYRDLARWNRLSAPYRLRVGQRLLIDPRGRANADIRYTVQRGNNLQAIAEVFDVRYRDVMRWNDLPNSRLRAGQRLLIKPNQPTREEQYQVRQGDSIARIARRFGVPVQDVLTVNGLGRRSVIRPGQTLVIYVAS